MFWRGNEVFKRLGKLKITIIIIIKKNLKRLEFLYAASKGKKSLRKLKNCVHQKYRLSEARTPNSNMERSRTCSGADV